MKEFAITKQVEQFVQHLDVKAGWERLAHMGNAVDLLRQMVRDVKARRGKIGQGSVQGERGESGTIAIFHGPSGTGKTLAAEVLAKELHADLYRVDLSAVVSHYVGETEKHLEQIFTAAEQSDWVLFLDEADALFGRRTEVKDGHDRYADIDLAYASLVRRLENFKGTAIIASSSGESIDRAILRRCCHVVQIE